MPPVLALTLCIVFVTYLLRLEAKEAKYVSRGAWIPTLWIMACASKSLALWFSFSGGTDDYSDAKNGSPWDRALAAGLMLAGMLLLTRRQFDWHAFRRGNFWLLAIYAYALISIAWSDCTFISIKRYIRFVGTVVMAMVVMAEPNPRRTLESILRRTVFVLIPFSLLLIKYYPQLGVFYGRWSGELMWAGTADHKNSLGILCFVSSFYLFWRLLRAWQEKKSLFRPEILSSDLLVFIMAAYLLKGPPKGYSATSISVFVLGVSVLLLLKWIQKGRKRLALSTVIGAVVALFIYGAGTPFGLRSVGAGLLEMLGRDATFTDRDQIWAELIPIAMQHPVLGRGYGGFWVDKIETEVNEAHNGYLNVALELGFLGVLMVFGFALSMCAKAHRTLSKDFWFGSLGLCLLLMIVLHNTSEASLLKTSDLLWSILAFVSVLLPVAAGEETAGEGGAQAMQSVDAPDYLNVSIDRTDVMMESSCALQCVRTDSLR